MRKGATMNFAAKCFSLAAVACLLASAAADDKDKPKNPTKPYGQKLEKVDVTPKEWKSATANKTSAAAVDELLLKLLKQESLKPAPLTTDEQFLRRSHLDLTGKLP